ncbi:MAG: hypothetical protein ABF695_12525 [Liquorilactobacillus ghanensis]|uniref:hypothetical protein n=1 Tax=Liquorilactobacillus ghanensis TaxID=399370 RepID=UPI0039EB7F69
MKKIVSMSFVWLCVLSLVACSNKNSSKSSNSSKTHTSRVTNREKGKKDSTSKGSKSSLSSSTSAPSSSATSVSSSSVESSSSSKDDNSNISSLLIGKTISVVPLKYDGMDIDKAMEQSGAPQNLVSDYDYDIIFTSPTSCTYHQMGTDFNASYSASSGLITIKSRAGTKLIPYSLNNGIITFNSFTTNESTGNGETHKFTWTVDQDN